VDWWLADGVDQLLLDGSAESKRQVRRVFTNRSLAHNRDSARVRILRKCAEAGLKEAYQFYLPLLDVAKSELPSLNDKGESSGTSFFEPTVAECFAREIVEEFAPGDPDVQEIVKKYPKTADQISPLKKWLQSRIAASKE
jgi:hypothetical protein